MHRRRTRGRTVERGWPHAKTQRRRDAKNARQSQLSQAAGLRARNANYVAKNVFSRQNSPRHNSRVPWVVKPPDYAGGYSTPGFQTPVFPIRNPKSAIPISPPPMIIFAISPGEMTRPMHRPDGHLRREAPLPMAFGLGAPLFHATHAGPQRPRHLPRPRNR
jgi:hypothetical protein